FLIVLEPSLLGNGTTYVQALAKVVGPTAIVAASKMYGKVVFFLASEDAAQEARPGRMTGLVLREPELRLVLSAYADDVLLVVQDPGDLARVEACQAIYSAASSARVNWVKSSGLAVGDWRQGSVAATVAESRSVRQRLVLAEVTRVGDLLDYDRRDCR
ncbi:unnamed protein product, partial [Caretta caretta]